MNQREWAIAILENRIEDAEKNTENEHMSCAVSAEQLRTVLLALRASPSGNSREGGLTWVSE